MSSDNILADFLQVQVEKLNAIVLFRTKQDCLIRVVYGFTYICEISTITREYQKARQSRGLHLLVFITAGPVLSNQKDEILLVT